VLNKKEGLLGGKGADKAVCQAQVDRRSEVEGGHQQAEPLIVAGDTAVAELPAAVLRADQPVDGAFHHGPVLPVGVAEFLAVRPVPAGLPKDCTVGMQVQGPAPCPGRAPLAQRAAAAASRGSPARQPS
jgi:hypothetical protein